MKNFVKMTSALATLQICFALASSAVAQQPAAAPVSPDFVQRPRIPGQNVNGVRVYIYAGLKTHGDGQHDYPQFLADWSKLLNAQGAMVTGSLHAPTSDELKNIDVLVIYKGDAGYMSANEKAALDGFAKRGGGIISLHDALCGPNPAEFARYVGGAKKHGEVNYTNGATVAYEITAPENPIMKGMTNLAIYDESFYKMTWSDISKINVLATAAQADTPGARRGGGVGQVVPQIWTYEYSLPGGQPARSFAWMQGHTYANFANPQLRDMILRAIAWAGKRPVDELVDYKPAPRPVAN